jgi:hypothetical protein
VLLLLLLLLLPVLLLLLLVLLVLVVVLVLLVLVVVLVLLVLVVVLVLLVLLVLVLVLVLLLLAAAAAAGAPGSFRLTPILRRMFVRSYRICWFSARPCTRTTAPSRLRSCVCLRRTHRGGTSCTTTRCATRRAPNSPSVKCSSSPPMAARRFT